MYCKNCGNKSDFLKIRCNVEYIEHHRNDEKIYRTITNYPKELWVCVNCSNMESDYFTPKYYTKESQLL